MAVYYSTYVDDLLLAHQIQKGCIGGTQLLLTLLWEARYMVLRNKIQICQQKVKYFNFHLSQGQHHLRSKRKQAVCSIQVPTTQYQVQEFLEATGYIRIWVPNLSILVKLLYKVTRVRVRTSVMRRGTEENAFEEMIQALTIALGLELPDKINPFLFLCPCAY